LEHAGYPQKVEKEEGYVDKRKREKRRVRYR